jgi:hypothetical protein
VLVKGDQADIVCNECRAVIRTVRVGDVQAVMSEMAQTDVISSAPCTHCSALNTFPGLSLVEAFICSECGEGVALVTLVQWGTCWPRPLVNSVIPYYRKVSRPGGNPQIALLQKRCRAFLIGCVLFIGTNEWNDVHYTGSVSDDGVMLSPCRNAMRVMNVKTEDLLPFVSEVDSGIAEIVRKQEAGWAYIH